jgi:hypothetical protein
MFRRHGTEYCHNSNEPDNMEDTCMLIFSKSILRSVPGDVLLPAAVFEWGKILEPQILIAVEYAMISQ